MLGKPNPSVPVGVKVRAFNPGWETVQKEIGAGWFLDHFVYLFGEGLEDFLPCLDAWSFLVPPGVERKIIGKNNYGALLVVENADAGFEKTTVHLVDPLQVRYWSDPNISLLNLCGNFLPQRRVPGFLDSEAHDDWIAANGDVELELDDILGLKVPLSLGGELSADNLQLDGIVDYYRTTGPIYADAFAKLRAQ